MQAIAKPRARTICLAFTSGCCWYNYWSRKIANVKLAPHTVCLRIWNFTLEESDRIMQRNYKPSFAQIIRSRIVDGESTASVLSDMSV